MKSLLCAIQMQPQFSWKLHSCVREHFDKIGNSCYNWAYTKRHCFVALWWDTGREGTCWNLKELEVGLEINWYPKVLVQHYAHLVFLSCINASCTWEKPTYVVKSCPKGLCWSEPPSGVSWCLQEPPGWGAAAGMEQLQVQTLPFPPGRSQCPQSAPAVSVPLQTKLWFLGRAAAPSCAHLSPGWTGVLPKATLPRVEFHLCHSSQCREGGKDGINIHIALFHRPLGKAFGLLSGRWKVHHSH